MTWWIIFLALSCVLLLTIRRRWATWVKMLVAVPLAAGVLVAGFVAAGVGLDMEGSGMPRFVRFESHTAHAARVEANREMQKVAPVVVPDAPVAVPVAKAEPATPAPSVNVWTDFRGPNRDGIYTEKILTAWPGGKLTQLWRTPVGGGWASMIIADGLLYTIEQRRKQEVVAAYDVKTGREVWAVKYDADFQESMGGPGPRATPTWHEGKIYSLGATGELYVLEARSGKVLWHKNILDDNNAENLTWAMSASPLIVDNNVIVQPGGPSGKSIVAYQKNTGERVWGSLGDKQSYTSPMLATLGGKRQILTVTGLRVVGLEPETGKLIWEYPWVTDYDVNSFQPILTGANSFIIAAGYGHGTAKVEVDGAIAKKVWENKKLKGKFNSAVLLDGYVYGFDEAIFTCIDVKTGEARWKAGRYGYGQVLLADGHLIVTTEDGQVVLLKADPSGHREIAKFQSVEGRTWNVPAIADGRLFVRNGSEMVAYWIAP